MADSSDGSPKKAAEAEEDIKLLFVANDDKNLLSTFAFLEKRGWSFKLVTTMKEAFAEIGINRPTHVLVSWNLTKTNVPKAEKAITRGFKVPCIIFTEKELDAKKQHALAASGVKNYLMAQISGTSVHVKIRALIHERLAAEQDPDINKKMKAIVVKGDGSNVIKDEKITIKVGLEDEIKSILDYMPKEAEWEQHGTAPDGTPLWRLKRKSGEVGKSSFVFKGAVPPTMENNRWKMPEGGGSFQQVEVGYKNNSKRRVELREMVTYDEDGNLVQNKFEMQTTISSRISAMGQAKKITKPKWVKASVKFQMVDPNKQKKIGKMALFKKPPPSAVDKLQRNLEKDKVEYEKQAKIDEAMSFAARQKVVAHGNIQIEMIPKEDGPKVNEAVVFKGAKLNQGVKSAAEQVQEGKTKKTMHQMFATDKKDQPKIKNLMSQLQQQKKQLLVPTPKDPQAQKPKKPVGPQQKKVQQNNKLKIDPKNPQGVTKGMKVSGAPMGAKPTHKQFSGAPLGAKANVKAGTGKGAKPMHKQFNGQKAQGNKAKVFSGNKLGKAQVVSQDRVKMQKGKVIAQDKVQAKGSQVKGALMEAKKQKSSLRYMPKKNAAEVAESSQKIKLEIKAGKATIAKAEFQPKVKLANYRPRVQEKVEQKSKAPPVKIEKLPDKLKPTSPLTAPRREKPQKEALKKGEKIKPQKEAKAPREKIKPIREKNKPNGEGKVKTLTAPLEKTKVIGKKKESELASQVASTIDTTESDEVKATERVPLQMVTHVDCVPINSKTFSGLLIFGTSLPKHCGSVFARKIKEEMLKIMSASGEKMKDEGELELVIQPFNFVEVASEIADFVTITEHNGVELGSAFIPCKGVIPEFGETKDQGMIEVALEKIKPGEKLTFDAYIHLPLNQKYIRYVKEGGSLEESQFKNMTDYKVTRFFVKSSEVKTVKSHFASNFVEKVIQDFIKAAKKSA